MEEGERILFSFQEVVELLVKKRGIHGGLWTISFGFDLGALNVSNRKEPDVYHPAALIPITEIGIQKVDNAPDNLTVDASVVNPLSKKKYSTKAVKTKKSK